MLGLVPEQPASLVDGVERLVGLHLATHVDAVRLRALALELDLTAVTAALEVVCAVCAGDPAGGPAALDPPGKRFRWLIAPRSTVVRPGPVHVGMTHDPAAEVQRLLARLVLPVSARDA